MYGAAGIFHFLRFFEMFYYAKYVCFLFDTTVFLYEEQERSYSTVVANGATRSLVLALLMIGWFEPPRRSVMVGLRT